MERQAAGRFPVSYLYNDMIEDALPPPEVYLSKGSLVGVEGRYVCKEVVDTIHKAGKKISVYFTYIPELEDYFSFLVYLGVDAVITDQVSKWTEFLDTETEIMQNNLSESCQPKMDCF